MGQNNKAKYVKSIPNSKDAYAWLKPITDAAQAGELKPWSPAVVELLEGFGVTVDRLKDLKVQANLSFPTSTKNRSMAIGFRHAKDDGSFAEDLFVFEENIGLTCYYRGSQEDALPEYAGTHHATIVLKEFLPDLQKELANIRQEIKDMANSPRVDYVSDEQFELEMQQITDDFNEQVRSFTAAHGNSSAPQVFAMAAQREATKKRATLKAKKAVSDRFYKQTDEPAPEISLIIIAQANNNKFDVTLINNSGRHLVAEEINVGGVKTELNQQFLHQYPLQQVNCPEGIFDNELNGLDVTVRYRTLDGKQYELLQQGRQEHRAGDGRYNLIFPGPASIKAL